jgi:hypothetical protein
MNVTFNVVAFTSNFIPTFLPRYCEPGTQTVKDGPWYNTPPPPPNCVGQDGPWYNDTSSGTHDKPPGHWWNYIFNPADICSTVSLFVLFLVAYKGAGSFAKVNVLLFAGLMLSLALGIGSIFMG